MPIRVCVAAADQESQEMMSVLFQEALKLVCHDLSVAQARTRGEVVQRTQANSDDVVFLDWSLVGAETPALVREMVRRNARIRTVVLLPEQQRQYRQVLWEAGACSSIPKEYLDQEWISSALCLIRRAMEREARVSSGQWAVVGGQSAVGSGQSPAVRGQKPVPNP